MLKINKINIFDSLSVALTVICVLEKKDTCRL